MNTEVCKQKHANGRTWCIHQTDVLLIIQTSARYFSVSVLTLPEFSKEWMHQAAGDHVYVGLPVPGGTDSVSEIALLI